MRLLRRKQNNDDFELAIFSTDDVPPYAILSHTWIDGQEVTYDELVAGTGKNKAGYDKIRFCGQRAAQDNLKYFWVDTCCIDKSDHAELSQAIHLMFRWYRDASRCYVYLSDVPCSPPGARCEQPGRAWESAFRRSRWFTRGWTLQELLAPSTVEFFSREGSRLDDKSSLGKLLHEITGIPKSALEGARLNEFTVDERFIWAERRQTKLPEDKVYSLSGIFDIQIPLYYGKEGAEDAHRRLREAIDKREKCMRDLYITDPRDDKKRIEDTKGGLLEDSFRWILENSDFRKWRGDQEGRLLWIKGDPGKGKTMLLCGISNALDKPSVKTALISYFFCQATDLRLNNATAVLRGLIYQLASQQPSLVSHIQKKYDQAGKALFEDANAWVALSKILTNMLQDQSLSETHIVIDALDECIADLHKLLDFIARQATSSSRVKWIVSSRNRPDIEEQLERVGNNIRLCLELNAESVSTAVSIYIQHKVNGLAQRKKYNDRTRDAVLNYLSSNADNTFLWVALVCQDLETIPYWNTLNRLKTFPPGLDSLYDRMLEQIRGSHSADLCTLILATMIVVYRPITLAELECLVDRLKDMSDNTEAIIEVIHFCGSFLTVRSGTIYFVHQSAKDYLSKEAPNEIFPFGIEETHHLILLRSLHALSGTLQRDIYGLRALGYPIEQVKRPNPDPLAATRYACVFWIDHLCDWVSGTYTNYKEDLCSGGIVELFMKKKYLYWLEALSLCGSLSEGVISIGKLEALIQIKVNTPEFLELVQDARRFILFCKPVIEQNPLQVYASAMIFSPSRSIIKEHFKHEEPDWISIRPEMGAKWSACLQTLEGHSRCVNSVAFSHDSTRLASASDDCTVKIWDASSGACLQTLKGHSEAAASVAFSHDSTRLASASWDMTAKIWDAGSGICLHTLEGHNGCINSIAFSHDSTRLASASYDCTVKIWDASSGACLQTLEGHSEAATSVAFSHDSTQLVSASWDMTAKIWDVDSGACLQTLEGHSLSAKSVTFSHDSTRLASASDDCTVKIWDASSGACLQTLEGHSLSAKSVAFSHDSTRLASASCDMTAKIWDVDSGACLQTLQGHSITVWSVAFSHDSTRLASASGDMTVKIWNADSGAYLQTVKVHRNKINSITFSHDSTQFASASDDGTIKIWDASSGACLQTLECPSSSIILIAFSHDSTRLGSVSSIRIIKIWNANSGACLQTVEVHRGMINSITFSHDSTRLALAFNDGPVEILDASSGACLQTLEGHSRSANCLAFSHDSTRLASASDDCTVKIWDAYSGVCLKTLDGHNYPIYSVAFSRDSTRLASVSWSLSPSKHDTVKIWDAGSGACLQTLNIGEEVVIISFDTTSSCLHTDIGIVGIDTPSVLDTTQGLVEYGHPQYQGVGLSSDRKWITCNSERLVWLPSDYRPSLYMSSCSAVSGRRIVIGTAAGKVWVYNL